MGSLVLTLKTDETQARLQQDFQIDTKKPKEAALALSGGTGGSTDAASTYSLGI
jgi:hypothetical protein